MNNINFNLTVEKNYWNKRKKQLNNESNSIGIVTSKSCTKFIKGLNYRWLIEVDGEPNFEKINRYFGSLINKNNSHKANNDLYIVALGGGSVIDTSKIINVMLSNNISDSRKLISPPTSLVENLKLICIPSTAGTGAEITPFSTLWDPNNGVKFSVEAESVGKREIILDAHISKDLPLKNTVSSGIDSLCQNIESSWSLKSTSESVEYSRLGFSRLEMYFNNLVSDLKNLEYREQMLLASYNSGLAISIANTTLCHSISYPITALLGVPHGLACGLTLMEVIIHNSSTNNSFIDKTLQVTNSASTKELLLKIEEILHASKFYKIINPYVKEISSNLDRIIPLTLQNSRSINNPVKANLRDIENILTKSLKTALNGSNGRI